MSEISALERVLPTCELLWVDMMRDPDASMLNALRNTSGVCRIREPHHVAGAIRMHVPRFVCFEIEGPETRILDSLMRVRHDHPELPVLLITERDAVVVAKWAVRLKACDFLVKPVREDELEETIASIAENWVRRDARVVTVPASVLQHRLPARGGSVHFGRTAAAVALVKERFAEHISLENAASACRLSPSQFCRVFKKTHRVSFGQYLMSFRMEHARELLRREGMLVKEVAYAIGFTDLSYFTRSFKRQFGVCPGAYRDGLFADFSALAILNAVSEA